MAGIYFVTDSVVFGVGPYFLAVSLVDGEGGWVLFR